MKRTHVEVQDDDVNEVCRIVMDVVVASTMERIKRLEEQYEMSTRKALVGMLLHIFFMDPAAEENKTLEGEHVRIKHELDDCYETIFKISMTSYKVRGMENFKEAYFNDFIERKRWLYNPNNNVDDDNDDDNNNDNNDDNNDDNYDDNNNEQL